MFVENIKKIEFTIKRLISVGDINSSEWGFLLKVVFTAYTLPALFLMCLVAYPDTYRQVLIPGFLLFPVFMSLFLLRSFRRYLSRDGWWKTLGNFILIAIGFLMFSGVGFGYTNFINALTAPDEVHVAAGEIMRLEPRRRDAPRVFVFDGVYEMPNIPITDGEYENMRVGDCYVSNFRLGGLGLYYRWRIDSWNRKWEARVARQG